MLKSRHYILEFLARCGFVVREGTNWSTAHYHSTITTPGPHPKRGSAESVAIVRCALRYVREQGKAVIPTCPFVRTVIDEETS